MNPKDRNCGPFLVKVEGRAKNYKRDHPLPLARKIFTAAKGLKHFSISNKWLLFFRNG